jgi:hypothetical protein
MVLVCLQMMLMTPMMMMKMIGMKYSDSREDQEPVVQSLDKLPTG